MRSVSKRQAKLAPAMIINASGDGVRERRRPLPQIPGLPWEAGRKLKQRRVCPSKIVSLKGFTPKVGNNLGTIGPKSGPKPASSTGVKGKTNQQDSNPRLVCKTSIRGFESHPRLQHYVPAAAAV